MYMNKKIILKVLENIAIRSCESYSWFGMYEPKNHKC